MVSYDSLPEELVCLILEFAAIAHVERHAGWVSTLLRISRPIYNVVQPILVHTVFLTSLERLCSASAHPHVFTGTRNLFIMTEDRSTIVATSSTRSQLAAAFHAIDGYRGTADILKILAADLRFAPRLVILPTSTRAIDYLFNELSPVLRHVTHLHVDVSIRYHSHMDMPDISSWRLTHVGLDLVILYYDDALLDITRTFLALPTMRTLCIRCEALNQTNAPATFEFWRQLLSIGDHRLQLDSDMSHDICSDQSSRVFDHSLWSPGPPSYPGYLPSLV